MLLAGRSVVCMSKLSKVVACKWNDRESNPPASSCQSDVLTVTLPRHHHPTFATCIYEAYKCIGSRTEGLKFTLAARQRYAFYTFPQTVQHQTSLCSLCPHLISLQNAVHDQQLVSILRQSVSKSKLVYSSLIFLEN